MTPSELARELGTGRVRPAYLIAGAEALLRDEAFAAIRRAALGDGGGDFDFERLAGERTTPGQLQDSVRALPLLAKRRLVVLREPEARKGGKGEALAEALGAVVADVAGSDTCTLVVIAEEIDRRARWVKAFAEPAAFVACDPPKNAKEALGFLRDEARAQGVTLEPAAAELLAESVGPNLLALRQELTKAVLFAGEGARVTRAHVQETICAVAEEPIWDLTDAIGEGRAADALALLARMLGAGAPPQVLLGSLAGHFRKLARSRAGQPPAGHPFMVQKLERQARRYSPARLLSCLRAIHEVDEVLKGQGALPPELALERLVLGLAA
ncbi:MAG TPA: DNA polymerase III subunit delta [Myxococcota bacterium]|jgi:DNA polymerase-3 subunit delta